MLLGLPIVIGLILLSKNAILIIAGEKYISSQLSLIILCLSILFSLFSTIFNQCVLLPFKREKVFLKSSVISAILNIVLNFFIIPRFGASGAAMTTLISELCMSVMNYSGCKDLLADFLFDKSFLMNWFGSMIGCIGVALWVVFIKKSIDSLLLETVFSICGAVFIYFTMLIVLKNEIVSNVLFSLKKDIHK